MTALDPDMRWGWRTVRPDFHSQHGYRWPWPGQWAEAPGPILDHNGPCPRAVGDGLCVALTWEGAAMGRLSARNPILVVGWLPDDELGRDDVKVRIRRGLVADVWSAETILRRAPRANLTGANLARANLAGANLAGANLTGANLARANLARANLTEANLYGANLAGANLARANLTRANLTRAYLAGANLARANLTRANLTRANLAGANLARANLARANLTRAYLVGAAGLLANIRARLGPDGRHP